jgi:hypothetical protein
VNEERAKQGIEHLQAAAIEVIAAVRAFLDVAEDVVRDPAAAAAMATSFVEAVRPTPPAHAPSPGDGTVDADARVTRIRVS